MEEGLFENNWFYEGDGEKKGPVTEKEIGERIHTGTLTAKSRVWKQGFTDWKRVEETELNTYVDKSVPPVVQVKSVMVWLLALSPLYASFIDGLILGFYQGFVGYNVTSAGIRKVLVVDAGVWVGLLFGLMAADEKLIKKAGYQEKISRWTWLITPLYLYKRSKLLNQNFLFLFVNLGCIVAAILFL
ncbi:DUF4339 domain-containing protein [Oxalobacter aliiformigenes]|uniref:DUF4339 domain-containing protein n=1 Tax=Oxalobacter aliiformigenes TaxID=2946593 RepID=A0ABY7JIU7_9BURK|nr:DUF4339 domain-containing protein [Oxalobacter aliiformigenes]WAV92996.1 DUF4339 domain-containing protein [Oxalobacter aliiformigenes]WAV95501.1 DUF4339 domain-containing protein [Oxalobacter aliiformigenes]WAV96703.1 DUF4339 domain-containing protein [Oxalobacter aliiformigenes]